ncbi:Riboflavin kinase [Enhygromyxa salina]|uniref:Bifunctional riboflavin kinase/FMN adenylyltransferase n=1 Tax=Enhygromyxa salina TaxID=215803 RepID=A0A0C2CY67_9BACT|nr:riboflavin biosynthesis protein RibF [Enhygromyxa salina]KIG15936.1 Riboflavin kinase [Enhygromyxa salina]
MRVLDFSTVPAAHAPGGLSPLPAGTAACLGAFDGMHRGHQGLIARARTLGSEVAVVTFEPRPSEVLARPGATRSAPPRLQTPGQREHVCRELGVDTLVILRFDVGVSRLSPGEFVEQFLLQGLRPAAVVVGYDFRFGAKRAGGPAELKALLAPAGIEVSVVEKITAAAGPLAGEKLGSTAVRELVAAGEVAQAAGVLGRLYAVAGKVEHGAARGRALGYPTANVASSSLHPKGGVYACFLTLLDADGSHELQSWPAVANLGTNPTFEDAGEGANPSTLEVHALDVDLGASLYDRAVEVSFVARLRDEQRFASVNDLREAIAADIERARPLLTPAAAARRHATRVEPESAPDKAGVQAKRIGGGR